MRIVFRDEELMTSIKVIFQLVSSEFVACERVYLTQVNDNTVDVSCVTNTLPVIEVRFIWASNNIPCSLYISKGRGLSYKAATRSAATNAMVPQAVDDDIKTCWRSTLELTSTDTLSMVLPAVFEVNGVCFTSRNLKYWHYFFDADGNKYAPFFDRDPDRDDFCLAQKQPTIVTNFSTKIQRKGMDSTEVSLCELVVNGDCAPPAYGLACEYICSRNCLERRCYLTGECMACASGTLGKFCERVGEEEFESLELVNFIPPQQKHGPVPKPRGQSVMLSSESIILLVMGVATFISIVISVCVYNKFNTGEYEEITAEEYFRRKWEEN
ncbi:uncharacterized protein LOC131935454 [Physella acuta]|uniref:uncharacterized protein LOC131935454 n=1 Tax=Physella acuta TaxID=109671 RepID=UPI0027DC2A96|nr:uncharacterized protein LOC131935454 [Physella acuta]